jgi:hypothetical protein
LEGEVVFSAGVVGGGLGLGVGESGGGFAPLGVEGFAFFGGALEDVGGEGDVGEGEGDFDLGGIVEDPLFAGEGIGEGEFAGDGESGATQLEGEGFAGESGGEFGGSAGASGGEGAGDEAVEGEFAVAAGLGGGFDGEVVLGIVGEGL